MEKISYFEIRMKLNDQNKPMEYILSDKPGHITPEEKIKNLKQSWGKSIEYIKLIKVETIKTEIEINV